MRRAAGVSLAALVLLVGACSDDEGDGEGEGDAVAAPTTTSAVDGSTTTAEATTTSTADPCRSVTEPGGEDPLELDFDGDGHQDIASTRMADGWRLVVELGGGGGAVDELLNTAQGDFARADATRDHDGDGDDELWVVVGSGASTSVYSLFDLDACDLETVQLGGGPAEFAVGGPVLLLQGVRCEDDGRITHLGATSEDGESYTTLDLTYELRGGELVRVADASGTMTIADDGLAAYSTFDC
jgi:hypothetical protein